MSTATGSSRPYVRGLLVGAILGAVVAGGSLLLYNKEMARRCTYFNYLPVLVAAQDIAPGTVLTLEMLSQQVVTPWAAGSSVVRSQVVNQVIGARTLFPLKSGDPLTWTGLTVGVTVDQCRQACEWVNEANGCRMEPEL